jgi:hypothetical protein
VYTYGTLLRKMYFNACVFRHKTTFEMQTVLTIGEKGTSHNHLYSSLPFLGYNNLKVRFVEVNKHFWGLEAINYFAAYIHYSMKS